MNITNIPAPRAEFIDPRTGLMSREWYMFFLNLFNLTGAGRNPLSLDDIQLSPQYDAMAQYDAAIDALGISPAEVKQAIDDYVDYFPAQSFQDLQSLAELAPVYQQSELVINSGTTAQYWRGDKTWQDLFTQVRDATLTELSTATNAVITAADTVLSGLGKLQAQISAILAGKLNQFASTTSAELAGVISDELGTGNLLFGFDGTFTATGTGLTTSPTGTVNYSRYGNTVVMEIPAITGTSNATGFTLTGMPATIFPSAQRGVI